MSRRKSDNLSATTLSVFVDRLENDLAVLIASDDDAVSFHLPRRFLPADTGEGDHFTLTFQPEPERRATVQQRIATRHEELTRDDESDPATIKL